MQITLRYQTLWQAIAYLMLVVILIASLLPVKAIQVGGGDKLHHFVSYAVLAWWFTLAFQVSNHKQLILLGLKLIAFSGIIEILQGLSGYRYAEWLDLLANSVGVTVGCIIAYKLTTHFLIYIERQVFK